MSGSPLQRQLSTEHPLGIVQVDTRGIIGGAHSGGSSGAGPYFDDGQITLYCEDGVSFMTDVVQGGRPECVIVTDPPYGDTSLEWDEIVREGWTSVAARLARSLWCFGSMRFWLREHNHFEKAGWRYAQEIVWEKHNGSSFHADRFKRVHELAVQWYRGDWESIYKDPQTTPDATARTVRRKQRPPHTGHIEAGSYTSEDGGPRLMRSVLQVRSEHGRAVHPTQKPLGILRPLIAYSTPVDGLVFDPFAGSGSTLLAARDLGRRAIGVERSEEYCEAAVKRLAQGVLAA